jgi:hypothetical protein
MDGTGSPGITVPYRAGNFPYRGNTINITFSISLFFVAEYSAELETALAGRLNVDAGRQDETALMTHFDESVVEGRPWREGVLKMSFCYILLDPVVLQRLPTIVNGTRCLLSFHSHDASDAERFRCFVEAVFYIGKGKRSRPYQHLIEAATLRASRGELGALQV